MSYQSLWKSVSWLSKAGLMLLLQNWTQHTWKC